ncbi:uncharacterized protein KGF55_004706 [Candida pseudojiufengensis]|uniref:uncharacterized protein n=1 Tax=Candida pseudojiufengensis TaxID=497109 RepID=UPI0022243139|nr:uncharacterized protein KGF55_004706 [Candida pseudojiufengensis]KAI5960414.1 hypothetical protein KGF55_004706 [Candida pseudojiufengensis]
MNAEPTVLAPATRSYTLGTYIARSILIKVIANTARSIFRSLNPTSTRKESWNNRLNSMEWACYSVLTIVANFWNYKLIDEIDNLINFTLIGINYAFNCIFIGFDVFNFHSAGKFFAKKVSLAAINADGIPNTHLVDHEKLSAISETYLSEDSFWFKFKNFCVESVELVGTSVDEKYYLVSEETPLLNVPKALHNHHL